MLNLISNSNSILNRILYCDLNSNSGFDSESDLKFDKEFDSEFVFELNPEL